MIAGACPDLEDAFLPFEAGLLEHNRDHRGRGDRLAESYGKGDILVRGHSVLRTNHRLVRHAGRDKGCSHAGRRRTINIVDRNNVAAVTGRPAFMKSFIVTVTPSRDAACTTITLHAAPRIVALPARVELAASASQSCVDPCGTTSARRSTAGTLLIRFERRDERPTSQTTPPERPPRAVVNPPWIAAESPETRTPPRTRKRPMKKRMMLQSTFAMRARGVVFDRNGRKNRTKEPPASATRGSQSGEADARKATDTAAVTPRVKPRPRRSRCTAGAEGTTTSGVARSFRKAIQTSPIDTARHTIVTGS